MLGLLFGHGIALLFAVVVVLPVVGVPVVGVPLAGGVCAVPVLLLVPLDGELDGFVLVD